MVQKIIHNDKLYSVIIRAEFEKDGIEFFTPDEFSQQLAYMKRERGYVIPPHVHNQVQRDVFLTKETVFVRKGKVRIDFYDDDKNYLESRILKTGDVVLLAYGGHGFKMLETTEMIEVKQGPYVGEKDKERFEPVDTSKIIVKNEKK